MRRVLLRVVVVVGTLSMLATGAACAGEKSVNGRDDAARLLALLSEPEISKATLRAGFPEFDTASRDAAVERVASQLDPPPSGPLLARLLLIRTPSNVTALRRAFTMNLRSPEPQARAASLRGLAEIGDADAHDEALSALRDQDDAVLVVALDILLPEAAADPDIRPLLEALHARWQADPDHHMSMRLLEANGVGAALR